MGAIPANVEDLTPAWFSEVLDADVTNVEVLDAHSGTTGRARVRLESKADVPETAFVKLQPFPTEQREFLRLVGLGEAEARLYAQVGNELPVRAPHVWHSSFDGSDGSFIMVLEDLEASGCRFPSVEDDDVVAIAESLVDELAKLHAKYWNDDLPWLFVPAGYRNDEAGKQMAEAGVGIVQSGIDQFADKMPPEFRQLGEFYVKHHADMERLYREGDLTLAHGDTHMGNLFADGGRTGFFDWAIVTKLPGMRDVAYFMCNSLPKEVRRAEEQGLISRYRAALSELGYTLDASVAQDQYRLFSTYAWMGAETTAAMGSQWQAADYSQEAMQRTTDACVDLDAVGLLTERLGKL